MQAVAWLPAASAAYKIYARVKEASGKPQLAMQGDIKQLVAQVLRSCAERLPSINLQAQERAAALGYETAGGPPQPRRLEDAWWDLAERLKEAAEHGATFEHRAFNRHPALTTSEWMARCRQLHEEVSTSAAIHRVTGVICRRAHAPAWPWVRRVWPRRWRSATRPC